MVAWPRAASDESPRQRLLAWEELLTRAPGSQSPRDVTSLGGEFQPRVASEELVPMGKPRRLSTKPPGERRRGSEPSCVCMCVHGCTCAWVCVRVCICACVLTRVSSVPRPHISYCFRVRRGRRAFSGPMAGEEVALINSPPVCSHPHISLKDSPSTKSCSKPMICTKRSLFNHDVSPFGVHAQIVWVEGAGRI